MKLITTPDDLTKEFRRLMASYNEFYWATAWAGSSSEPFDELAKQKFKIKNIIVGLHFYQTHPEFIAEFIDEETVKYIKQTAGTFHPKVYLFRNLNNDWEILIGSANFTSAAFKSNGEATLLVNFKDANADQIYEAAMQLIRESWEEAKKFSRKELEDYRSTWKAQKQKVNSLAGHYGSHGKSKPIYQIPALTMTWNEFVEEVRKEGEVKLRDRIRVIEAARNSFQEGRSFKDMLDSEREAVAGTIKSTNGIRWGFFGSMIGSGVFKRAIQKNDENISLALDAIGMSGSIGKENYDEFLKHFRKCFPMRNHIATATRLLAMKRPDTFVCLDSKNKKRLCKAFGIKQSNMDYERYWNEIIAIIFDAKWWRAPIPKDETEQKIYNARSAFLDALYYQP